MPEDNEETATWEGETIPLKELTPGPGFDPPIEITVVDRLSSNHPRVIEATKYLRSKQEGSPNITRLQRSFID